MLLVRRHDLHHVAVAELVLEGHDGAVHARAGTVIADLGVDGVSEGKMAQRVGIKAGDVIMQLGDIKFSDVQSYMGALGKFKKGDKTKLKIKRGAEEKEFDIEF